MGQEYFVSALHPTDKSRKVGSIILTALPSLLVGLFALLYSTFIATYSLNVPNADDFDMFLAFLINFLEAPSAGEAIPMFFARHGEHIILTCRLAALLSYKLLGSLDFKALIIAGNLAVPICIVLLTLSWRYQGQARTLGIATAAMALLQPQYVQVALWASGAIEHLWVMVFVLWSFFLAERSKGGWLAGLAPLPALLMSVCTQGNGLFASLLVALIFVVKRQFANAMLPGILFISMALFFQSHTDIGHGQTTYAMIDYARYFFGFLGAPLGISFLNAQIWGLATCVLLAYLCRDYKRNLTLIALALFVVLTAAANALARIHLGLDYAYSQSRYTFPALFLYIALLFLLLQRGNTRQQLALGLAIMSCVALGAGYAFIRYTPEGELRRNILAESAFIASKTGDGFEYPDQSRARALFTAGLNKEILTPLNITPPLPIQAPKLSEMVNAAGFAQVRGSIERVIANQSLIIISGYAFRKSDQANLGNPQIELINQFNRYTLEGAPRPRPDAAHHHRIPLGHVTGFLALADTTGMEEGTYAVRVVFSGDKVLTGAKTLAIDR